MPKPLQKIAARLFELLELSSSTELGLSDDASVNNGSRAPINVPTRATPDSFQSSATTATTITAAAALTGVALTNYVGNLVRATTGNCEGQWRIVTAYNGAGVLTVDAPFRPTDGTATPTATTVWEMYIAPFSIVVCSVAGAVASVDVVTADDVSGRPGRDPFNAAASLSAPARWFLLGLAGSNAGRAALITSVGVGVINVEAGVAGWVASTTGDVYLIAKLLEQYGGSFVMPKLAQVMVERDHFTGDLEGAEPEVGPRRGGEVSDLSLEVRRVSAVSSGATPARVSTMEHDLLASVFGHRAAGSSTTVAGSTTSQLRITNATATRFQVGDVVLVAHTGEMAQVLEFSDAGGGVDDRLTIWPPLSVAPPSGISVFGGVRYDGSRIEGHRSETLMWHLRDGARIWVHGFLPMPRLDGLDAEGGVPRWMFSGPVAAHWMENYSSVDTAVGNTIVSLYGGHYPQGARTKPFVHRNVRAHLAPAAGALAVANFAATRLRGWAFDPKVAVEMLHDVTGVEGTGGAYFAGLQEGRVRGSLTLDIANVDLLALLQAGTLMEFSAQWGRAAGQSAGLFLRRIKFAEPFSIEEGAQAWRVTAPFKVLGSNANGNSTAGGGATVRLPPWTFGLC